MMPLREMSFVIAKLVNLASQYDSKIAPYPLDGRLQRLGAVNSAITAFIFSILDSSWSILSA